ncbi:MAG: hypothetical protein E7E58_16815 [Paeniclostridium sordellii]|uniref:hypothetical protein n=1 Tax=Veillonella sp. TaxID=1926307 RepID=UPI0028FE039A|nr:hypothetical protein [Veillonella sp.]MDU2149655.1 hypothetical protein [Paeniclostridium sordellii]MDU2155161.1 hypothetical protein [Veillonella sp.]
MANNKVKKIPKPTYIPKKRGVKTSQPVKLPFIFKTEYSWLKTYKGNDFTNYHKDADDYAKNVTNLVHNFIPAVYRYGEDLFKGRKGTIFDRHSKLMPEDKMRMVEDIVREVDGINLEDDVLDSSSIWYLAVPQGIRVVGYYQTSINTFFPLFVDWHHLIFPNQNYNQADYQKFSYNADVSSKNW